MTDECRSVKPYICGGTMKVRYPNICTGATDEEQQLRLTRIIPIESERTETDEK